MHLYLFFISFPFNLWRLAFSSYQRGKRTAVASYAYVHTCSSLGLIDILPIPLCLDGKSEMRAPRFRVENV